jgi:ribosomal protein S18 acetylase RimI-like enzyme
MIVRQLLNADRDAVAGMLRSCGAFTAEEVGVALQLIDEGLAGGLDGEYLLFAAVSEAEVCGYVCIGQTPMTASTWHLYWICVAPRFQGTGAGQALQRYVEDFIRSKGGERLMLETSSQPGYERTHRFYQKCGYREMARIPDFYKANDDCVIYCKVLET